mmetsp:Transcript_29377/g.85424  ORF Transcript_29377/g.85424 Transcript_29377/m.85424 type:complete len:286 (+) Transcript_29377:288-1145(+)
MKLHLLFLLGLMLIVNVLGGCDSDDFSACDPGDCTRDFTGDTCEDCCDERAPTPRVDRCKGRCRSSGSGGDDDDDKCSGDSNQGFLDDLNDCLDSESSDGGGLTCSECEGCCEDACEDAEPGCGGASRSACIDRCEYRRCRDVCDSSDGDDDDSDTTFLSSDQTHKCSNKDSEDSCESCCENKCSNKSNSDDQLDSCKDHCIDEADCSEASSDSGGGSCSDKIDKCCDCLDDECSVESGDSADKHDKNCIKDECKNKYCKDAGKCKYGDRDDWKKVVDRKCNVNW